MDRPKVYIIYLIRPMVYVFDIIVFIYRVFYSAISWRPGDDISCEISTQYREHLDFWMAWYDEEAMDPDEWIGPGAIFPEQEEGGGGGFSPDVRTRTSPTPLPHQTKRVIWSKNRIKEGGTGLELDPPPLPQEQKGFPKFKKIVAVGNSMDYWDNPAWRRILFGDEKQKSDENSENFKNGVTEGI